MGGLLLVPPVPVQAVPVDEEFRDVVPLGQPVPPHGAVGGVVGHVGENGVALGGLQGVEVGLGVGAGGHAEEAVLRVYRPQPAVGAHPEPGDVVAHAPDLPARLLVALGGDEHGQVGLAAGGGEGGGQIAHLALGVLNAQDEHVLGHPALLLAQIGGDAQGKTLLAQQHVAAVVGVDGDDGVVLGEVGDVLVVVVQGAVGVQALDIVAAVPQGVQHVKTHPGHDGHVQHHIDGVGELDAVFGEGRAHHPHGVGDDIHGAPLHGALEQGVQLGVHLLRVHPVVGGAGVLPLPAADVGAVLHPGHVVGMGAVEIAAGELLLVEPEKDALVHGLLAQCLQLSLASVDPDDGRGAGPGRHLIDPAEYRLILCRCHSRLPPVSNKRTAACCRRIRFLIVYGKKQEIARGKCLTPAPWPAG